MRVGDIDIKWDMGYEAAADLLESINLVATTNAVRVVEGPNFRVEELEAVEEVTEKRITVVLAYSFYGV